MPLRPFLTGDKTSTKTALEMSSGDNIIGDMSPKCPPPSRQLFSAGQRRRPLGPHMMPDARLLSCEETTLLGKMVNGISCTCRNHFSGPLAAYKDSSEFSFVVPARGLQFMGCDTFLSQHSYFMQAPRENVFGRTNGLASTRFFSLAWPPRNRCV